MVTARPSAIWASLKLELNGRALDRLAGWQQRGVVNAVVRVRPRQPDVRPPFTGEGPEPERVGQRPPAARPEIAAPVSARPACMSNAAEVPTRNVLRPIVAHTRPSSST